MKFKEIEIIELFDLVKGFSKYTTKYGHENIGEYPVFSASTKAPLTYINTYDYNSTYLSWTTNGYGGYIFILSGKFSINGDRALLIPKVDNLSLEYIRYIAQPIFRSLARGRIVDGTKNEYTKVYPSMLEGIYIPIPIKEDGSFDLEAQKKIAKKYKLVEDGKKQALDYLKTIKNCIIKVEHNKDIQYKNVDLKDIFDFKKCVSNSSEFTKKFVYENQGDIPVYGATQFHSKPTYGYIKDCIDGVKYFENCLTWNIDGSLGCFYRDGRFSLSEKVIPLYLKDEYSKIIDLSFLSYMLIQKANEYGFSREFKPNQTRLKEVSIEIPIKQDGTYDLEEQQRIAKKYQNIESKRSEAIDMLKRIIDTQVKITME